MLLGYWAVTRSVNKASGEQEDITRLLPATAHRIISGRGIVDVRTSWLKKHDRAIVRPGDKIPADGRVICGESTVDEVLLTGDLRPAVKREGERVIGGALNGEGSLIIEVQQTAAGSYPARVGELLRTALETRSLVQSMCSRAAIWLVIAALIAGTLTFAGWLFAAGQGLEFALARFITVMVIACPQTLVLALPLGSDLALASARGADY